MEQKRKPGRPAGTLNKNRKGGRRLSMQLAPDIVERIDADAPAAGFTAAAERLLRAGMAITAAPPSASPSE